MDGARGVLLSVSGPATMTLHEVNNAANVIKEHCDDEAEIIFGAFVDDMGGEEMQVTVIAAGFERRRGTRGVLSGVLSTGDEDDFEIPAFVQG
jgi:cell division protein FtsZ